MFRKAKRLGLLIGAVGIATVIFGSTILVGMGEVAAAQAEMIERKLRNAGIRLTPEDVKAIKTIENHRKRFFAMYRELDAFGDAFEKKKTPARVAEIQKQKESMRLIGRQLPATDATVGGYYLEVRRYLAGPSAKHAEKMREIEASLKKYGTEVSAKTGADAIPEPTAPVKSRFDDYVLSVLQVGGNGTVEFYANGMKLTRAGQTVALKGNQAVTIRAVAVDARRKQSRTFQPSGTSELLERTDYRLKYRVKSGNFTGTTLWSPIEEKYFWKFTRLPNTNATTAEMTSSFDLALENDVMAFKFNGNFTTSLSVTGNIEWKGESQRPGGQQTMTSKGQGIGSITFNVGPG